MKNSFHAWLRSHEGGQFLDRCLGRQKTEADDKASFWEFLLLQEGRGSATLRALVEREDWEGLRRKIQSMHRLYLAEQNRDLLYQRVRQVLHAANQSFGYQAGDKYSWYGAADQTSPQAGTFEELREAGFTPTCPALNTEAIRTTEGILQLAATFREQLAAHRGRDCRIPLKTLCAFIRNFFEVSLVYEGRDSLHAPRTTGPSEADERPAGERDDPRHLPNTAVLLVSADVLRSASDTWLSEDALQQIAAAVAHQLDREKLLLLLCLRMYCDLSLSQTAQALGYAGPSGVAAPFKKALAVIEEMTSLVEGLAADDLNDDMYHHFLGLLLGTCKEDDCSRYA